MLPKSGELLGEARHPGNVAFPFGCGVNPALGDLLALRHAEGSVKPAGVFDGARDPIRHVEPPLSTIVDKRLVCS